MAMLCRLSNQTLRFETEFVKDSLKVYKKVI